MFIKIRYQLLQLSSIQLAILTIWALMMLPPSWGVARAIADRINPRWEFPAFVGLSALAMTAWDLFLDPMMVTWEIWVRFILGHSRCSYCRQFYYGEPHYFGMARSDQQGLGQAH